MPPKRPIRGSWPFEAQAPGVWAGALGAASAAVLVVSKVAVPTAATVKAARKPRRLSFQAIRVLPYPGRAPGLPAAAVTKVLGWTYRFVPGWWCQDSS